MYFKLVALLMTCIMSSSCVSAWMTGATGVKIKRGMTRDVVHQKLGPPNATLDARKLDLRGTQGGKPKINIVDVHLYRGKINTVDEGGGQAIANALTLGTAELIMIPMTAVDIIIRSGQKHKISVDYGADYKVISHSVSNLSEDRR